MQLANRHYVSGSAYRFGFNGKENDDEWNGSGNMLDFGARLHDPRLGRWLSLDPLASEYPNDSACSYAMNSPIFNIDEGGKSVAGWFMKQLFNAIGLGSATEITNTFNSWGLKGDFRNAMALMSGAAYTGVSLNAVDLAFTCGPLSIIPRAYRITSGLMDSERDASDVLMAEIPLVGRYLEYRDAINDLVDTQNWGDEEWYNLGKVITMGIQDAVPIAEIVKLGISSGVLKAKPSTKGTAVTGADRAAASPKAIQELAAENRILSGQKSVVPEIVEKYYQQMVDGTYDGSKGGGGFKVNSDIIIIEGNHRLNAAMRYGLETGDFTHVKDLINNGKFDNIPSLDGYGITKYPFPVVK